MDQRSHGRMSRGTKHLLDRVPHQGGDRGIPSGGLPWKGWDADGDAGTFMAQTCPGRRDHLGGEKPPPSKVLAMQHAGAVAVPKWETQEHHGVQEWGG